MITSHAHRHQCFRGFYGKQKMGEWTSVFMIGVSRYSLAPLNPNQPIFYFLLRCLKAEPARVFVVLLDFLLLKALLAFFATLLDVLGALAIFQRFILLQR
jgi:hypothetical protein